MLSYPLRIFPSHAHLEGVIKNGKYRRRPKTSHSAGHFKEKQLITPATTKSPNYEKTQHAHIFADKSTKLSKHMIINYSCIPDQHLLTVSIS